MSSQDYYDHGRPEGNPFADSTGQNPQQSQQDQSYVAPSGPPPGQAPQRTGTFKENDFVPDAERGEQREAMEQFEMSNTNESQTDKDVAQLQSEYPGVDGSLIAAIYGDSGMGGAREVLQELATQGQGGQ